MVVYIEMDGNVKILSPENLYQGSTTNRVTLITPFPSTTAVGVGFILPDGTTVTDSSGSNYFPMELLNTETSAGVTATAYEYVLPFTVLEQYGELKLAFKATFTNGNQTSYLAAVEVQESILPTPPENPDEDTYQLLLQYIQTAMQNAANAQSAAEAAQTAAESAETKAAAAETTAGQANETANAANTTAGQANTKADQAVTTSNNAAATAAAANQTAIEAKNQAGAAQTAAAQAQEDADAAAKSAQAAENSASEAADSAEEAVTTANEAKTTADGIDGKATQALTNSEQAVTTANKAKELAEQAVAGAGTEVYVNNALQSRLDFTADPQTQIDNIKSGTTKVGSAAQADKLAQARNLKVDLASGEAQSFDGSANTEDIGVDGVLPVANGGTGASDLDSVKVGEAGSADKATKLATARNMQVNLASGNQQPFDGSGDATEIGVKGILPIGNGGTGSTNLANITVGKATADGSGNNIENTYVKNNVEITDLNNITQQSETWQAYLCESAANQPVDGGGLLFQYRPSAEWLAQLFIANDAESTTWRRNYRANNGWTAWQKVLTGAAPGWVTGTSGSITLPSSGWYYLQASGNSNFSLQVGNSGIVYVDITKSIIWFPLPQNLNPDSSYSIQSTEGTLYARTGSDTSTWYIRYYKLA